MVRLRLQRMGRRHRPFYRLNAVEKRTQRDGRVLESLGWYNPMAKEGQQRVELKADRIKAWLEQGAQASDTVNDLLAEAEIIDAAAWKAVRERRRKRPYAKAVATKQAEAAAKAEAEAAAKAEAEAEAAAKAAEAEAATTDAEAAAPAEEESSS